MAPASVIRSENQIQEVQYYLSLFFQWGIGYWHVVNGNWEVPWILTNSDLCISRDTLITLSWNSRESALTINLYIYTFYSASTDRFPSCKVTKNYILVTSSWSDNLLNNHLHLCLWTWVRQLRQWNWVQTHTASPRLGTHPLSVSVQRWNINWRSSIVT